MHTEAYTFVSNFVKGKKFERVLEFGSRDINGSVRNLFDAKHYHGIDLYPGPGVDEVADATAYFSEYEVDCVVCCELLEHTPVVESIVRSASSNLKQSGFFVVTCATDPRAPHSTHDGGQLHEGEYYANVDVVDLVMLCRKYQLRPMMARTDRRRGDLYLVAQRH